MEVEKTKKAENQKTENQKTEAPTAEQTQQRKLKKYNKIKFPKL